VAITPGRCRPAGRIEIEGSGSGLLAGCGPWRRIAVLRPGRIGDYLCATPAVRALKRAVPHARLDYVGLPLVRDLVARNPYVDRFIPFPGFPNIAEQFFEPRRAVAWLARMQAERYDLVVQLYGSGVYANPIALLLGGRCCVGFVRRRHDGDPGLDAAVPLPGQGPEVDRALALTRHLGAGVAGRAYDLRLRPADRAAADRAVRALPRPVVGLHAGARDDGRRVAPEVLGRAASRLGECSVVMLGGPEERDIGARVAASVDGPVCRNLAGATPLAVAAAVVAGLDALLTTDSAPAHLAYAVGTPSVTLFLDSDPARWGPPVPGPHTLLDCRSAREPDPAALAGLARRLLDGAARPVTTCG
jgi:ADP-heptose:LPS heptosyltransferase